MVADPALSIYVPLGKLFEILSLCLLLLFLEEVGVQPPPRPLSQLRRRSAEWTRIHWAPQETAGLLHVLKVSSVDPQLARVHRGGRSPASRVSAGGVTLPNAADPEAGHSAAVDGRMQAEASLVLQGKI